MSSAQRIVTFCCFAAALAALWLAQGWIEQDHTEMLVWGATIQLGGTLLAAIFCFVAAYFSAGTERSAWRNFGIGSSLYLLGNLGYIALTLPGAIPSFPSLPEAAYFAMAGFFAAGMLQFSQLRKRFGAIQIYNFALIFCAVALSAIFVLNRSIAASAMSPWATVVAFLYPALWFSVAAFGVVSLALYAHGRKSVSYALMVLAVLAEAVADFRYALALMEGSYQPGGMTQLLWVASSGLIIWSAVEQIIESRQPQVAEERPGTRRTDRSIAQASVPAVAVGGILLAGSLSGVLGGVPYSRSPRCSRSLSRWSRDSASTGSSIRSGCCG